MSKGYRIPADFISFSNTGPGSRRRADSSDIVQHYMQSLSSSSPVREGQSSRQIPINPELQISSPIPLTGYNSAEILDYYDKRPLEVAWRLNILGLPLLGWYFGLVSDRYLFGEQSDSAGHDNKRNEMVQRKRGSELRQHLVNSGSVALIKSGQALSLRPDLLKNKIWSEELSKLVDAVGSFSDVTAMNIIRKELKEITPRLTAVQNSGKVPQQVRGKMSRIGAKFANDPVLSLFEFANDNKAVASASIGQVYKAKLRRGPLLEAAIGKKQAEYWGGKAVAIKVQRPDASASIALDMYLIRKVRNSNRCKPLHWFLLND